MKKIGIIVISAVLLLLGCAALEGVLNKGIAIHANGTSPFELPVTIKFMEFSQPMQELFKR